MKTRRYISGGLVMAAAALLCLAGCKKDEEGEKVVLGTQFEKAVSAQKTYLGENNTVCWSEGDEVTVNTETVTVSDGSVEVTEAESYYAVYPATDGNNVGESGGTVEIPATQTYTLDAQNSRQVLNGPMAARLDSKSGKLYFKNLYSLLKVTVAADDKAFTVNSITVTGTGNLAGTYGFGFNGETSETAPTVGDIVSGSNSVTLNCSSDNTVSANEDKDFYIVVHPLTTAQKLTVKVNGELDGKMVVYTYNTLSERTLNRSCIGGLAVNLQQLNPVVGSIGRFSVAENRVVTFSPGNLQYRPSTNTWRFAEHQWDYVGDATNGTVNEGGVKCNNASISPTYTGWIDLFGWGTSGWDNGNRYFQPYDYDTLTGPVVYNRERGYGYGPTGTSSSYNFDLIGTYANSDWGVYNPIGSDTAGTWRTLTDAEWIYLLGVNGTGRSSGHPDWWIFNMVKITDGIAQGVKGAIIYPDGITGKPAGILANLTQELTTDNLTIIDITEDDFAKLEAAGCVFLPAAGYRKGTSITGAGSFGTYWSSMCQGTAAAHNCYFNYYDKKVSPNNSTPRYEGRTVRLVKDIE